MTDDIVVRLRAGKFNWDCDEAADEIEQLRLIKTDWRAAMTENHDLWRENERLRAKIQQLKKKTNSVYNDWSDAICENSDLREKNAELRDEIERLRAALREVLHIADGYGSSSGRLVLTASAALEGEKKDIMRTLVDKINQQAIAIAERDEFIEIMGMCNEFEEFLSK